MAGNGEGPAIFVPKNEGAGKPKAEGVKARRSTAKGEEKRGRQAEKKSEGAGKPKAEGVKARRSTAKGEEKRGRQAEKKNEGAGKPKAEGKTGEKKGKAIRSTAKDEENGSILFAADDKKEKEQIIVDMYRAVRRRKMEEKLEVGGEEGRGWFLSKYDMHHVDWVLEMMIELSKQGVNSIGDGDTDRRSMPVKAKNKRNGKLKKFWKGLLKVIPAVIPAVISALVGDPVLTVVSVFSLLCNHLQGALTN